MSAQTHVVPLLRVNDLVVRAGSRELVKGVSFELQRGECLALVGESGSGKTMAARAVLGLLPAGVQATGGSIQLQGEELRTASTERLRALRGATVGMVFQEPMVSLNPAMRIGAQMAEALHLHTPASAAEIQAHMLRMLVRISIPDPRACLGAYPHEFSGGMRQRIMLASVMLLKPALLIADEPTTALDTLSQAEVLDLMRELAQEAGTSVLLITHNLGLVKRYAQRIVVMRHGQVVECGAAAAVLAAPRQAYTRLLVEAMPRRKVREAVGPGAAHTPQRQLSTPILEARGLSLRYGSTRRGWFSRSAGKLALGGVDLSIHEGETVAVVGGSGSGKTTLGRALLHLHAPTGGELRFRGELVGARSGLVALRRACQFVFQDPFSSLNPRQRVAEIVGEPLRLLPAGERGDLASRVLRMLDDVGLNEMGERWPHQLSGGQRQRVAIARALVRRPALVVADEPVSALDMSIQAQVLALFAQLQREYGFACVFISHDLPAVGQIADRVVVMQAGQIVEQGPCHEVFDHPRHPYTRALLAASPTPV